MWIYNLARSVNPVLKEEELLSENFTNLPEKNNDLLKVVNL